MRVGIAASGIALIMLGIASVVLFFLTDTVSRFTSLLQLRLIAGAMILAGLVLFVLGLVTRSRSKVATIAGSQAAYSASCPRCGGQLPPARGKIRCPYCGKKVFSLAMRRSPQIGGRDQVVPSQQIASTQEIQRFCTYCGASLHPTSNFCQRCGKERRI
jgi:DNA-directed RNA polymerase subunit RPC12/RpoP